MNLFDVKKFSKTVSGASPLCMCWAGPYGGPAPLKLETTMASNAVQIHTYTETDQTAMPGVEAGKPYLMVWGQGQWEAALVDDVAKLIVNAGRSRKIQDGEWHPQGPQVDVAKHLIDALPRQ